MFQLLLPAIVSFTVLLVYSLLLRSANSKRRAQVLNQLGISGNYKLVGFFHPYCNAGGGGERVLWTAIAGLQRNHTDIVSVVYSGDVDASKQEIIDKVKSRFDITLHPSTLHFVFLVSRKWVEDSTWPRFTLLGQSLGSMYLVWEAMSKLIPDLFIDTMGYAFTFPVVSFLGRIPVGAYVHYPTISTDMLARVSSRKAWHTNSDTISSSPILSRGKLIYYRLFMFAYSHALRTASFMMVNSSWTKNHVDAILQHKDRVLDYISFPLALFRLFNFSSSVKTQKVLSVADIVYPPCDTREMAQFPLTDRAPMIISVAQFRPEKDHAAQIKAFHLLRTTYKNRDAKLVLIGGSRNADDSVRVDSLKSLAKQLQVDNAVEFLVNASYPDMLDRLSKASVGLNTMVDEHFGINVVEYMAAGVIPVTHASGGPLNDIVVPINGEITGYHATTPESFAEALHTALALSPQEDLALRTRARTWAIQRFSEAEFERGWEGSGWKSWIKS